jgi:hypothetical protein
MTNTKYSIFGIGFVALIVTIVVTAIPAGANPSQFFPTKETASATTTLVYMTPGTATTTLSYDSYQGDAVKIDQLTLAIQYTASTTATAPTLKLRLEDSMDNINWYPRASVLNSLATSTQITGNFGEYLWNVSSSTATDFGGSGTATRMHTSLVVDAPMRYVRAKFYTPVAGGNGGLWAQMIPFKELNGR